MNILSINISPESEFIYVVILIAAFLVNRSIAASVFFATRSEAETNDDCEDYFFHSSKVKENGNSDI